MVLSLMAVDGGCSDATPSVPVTRRHLSWYVVEEPFNVRVSDVWDIRDAETSTNR